ncbi:amidohydrolase, partial [bacterium]|nr:amidohydrolase [bacterium]
MANSEIIYFDSFAAIGRRAGKDPGAPWTTEALLAEMERCQVRGALVFSHQAKEVHPAVGNPIVCEVCDDSPRLYPCWIGLPHHSGEFPSPDPLVNEMATKGVRALKIYPRYYKHAVDDRTLGELLEALQEQKILLIVDRGEHEQAVQIEWSEIAWVCESFPSLPLLLHSVRWESTRQLIPLAAQFSNLHFEFSNYQGNRMLEFWCKKIGHERLLFGSEALEKSIGAARAYIDYSDLTHEQRHAIAGGNLQRLLGLAEPPPSYSDTTPRDAIVRRALSGKPISDMTVIDAHAHIVQKDGRGAAMVVMNEADARGVVERNRKLGVKKTCISAWTAIWSDYKLGNKDTQLAAQEFP